MITRYNLLVSKHKLTRFLIIVSLIIILLAIVGLAFRYGLDRHRVFGFIHMFNFEQETNVPTLFTTLLLLLNGALLLIIWMTREPHFRRHAYLLLGLLAFFLAYDEYASVHEAIAEIISQSYPESYFLIPYAAVGGLLGMFFLPSFVRLSTRTQSLLVLSAIVYLIGAADSFRLLMEALGYTDVSRLTASIVTMIEETFELAGLILLANTLVVEIKDSGGVSILVGPHR